MSVKTFKNINYSVLPLREVAIGWFTQPHDTKVYISLCFTIYHINTRTKMFVGRILY